MKLQRTLPLLLRLARLAGCGAARQTAIESARDAEMNEAIGILTDTGTTWPT